MAKLRSQDAEARKENPAGRDFSEALARGLTILTAFSSETTAMTLSNLSRQVDLPKATVRRALLTLQHLGYVREEGRLFRLLPSVLRFSGAYLGSDPVASLLQPACEQLAKELGVICSAAVLDQNEAVMVSYASPRQPRLYNSGEGIGLRLPAYCSAVGRVLMAALATDARVDLLAAVTLASVTPLTVIDPAALLDMIERVAQDGFALVDQEVESGFRSIAVPLRRRDGTVLAALNIGVRTERASIEQMRDTFLLKLRDAAERLGEQLL